MRYAPGGQAAKVVKVDIDLCDEQGNICAQMRGVSWQAPTVMESPSPDRAACAKKSHLTRVRQRAHSTAQSQRKEAGELLLLLTPRRVVLVIRGSPSQDGHEIALAPAVPAVPAQASEAPAVSSVRLYDAATAYSRLRRRGGSNTART